jgi:hypothetical protein
MTLGIGATLWLAFRKQTGSEFGVLTTEREEIYKNALEFLQDPLKLEELATHFQREGLKVQAAMLRKRAEWRGRSEKLKAEHDLIFKRAMESTNIHGILGVAEAFEKMTATVKSKELRNYAKKLYDANEIKAAEAKVAAELVINKNESAKTNGVHDIPRNTNGDDDESVELVS